MKRYIGKKVKLHFLVHNTDFYYSAIILDVTQEHITFKDKYGEIYTYRLKDLVTIKGDDKDA